MRYKGNFVIIARDGWPLEQVEGRPIHNFFRRLFLGSHYQCRTCLPCMNPQPVAAQSVAPRADKENEK